MLEVYFPDQIERTARALLVAVVDASEGQNIELCRGAWIIARGMVGAFGGEPLALIMDAKAELASDVWALLESGGET